MEGLFPWLHLYVRSMQIAAHQTNPVDVRTRKPPRSDVALPHQCGVHAFRTDTNSILGNWIAFSGNTQPPAHISSVRTIHDERILSLTLWYIAA